MTDNAPCDFKFLGCMYGTSNQSQIWAKSTKVFTECDVDSDNINYGIFIQAIKNRVFELIISRKIFLLPVVGNAIANVHLIILSLLLCMSFDSSSLVPYYHATNHPYKWVQTIHNVENWEGKSLYHPLTYGGGLHNPPTYKTVYITPLNFSKPVKLPPKAVLKNHSKS